MLSIDQKILDPDSPVSERMRIYGAQQTLSIVIPSPQQTTVPLSPSVTAYGTGGANKIVQLFRLRARARELIREKGITQVSTQDPFFLGWVGLGLCKKFGITLEVQLHGDFYGSSYYLFAGLRSFIQYWLGKYIVRRADHVRVVGGRVRESVLKLGVDPSQIVVRPVALDTKKITQHRSLVDLHTQFPKWKKIFITVGRLERVKNISWLIDVFAAVVKTNPEYGLVIIGDGSQRKSLEVKVKKAKNNLQDNITFTGWVDDSVGYMQSADGFLFPSLTEGYGLVVLEALAAGCPVVMHDVGVAGYEVQPSDQVQIIPINNHNAFAQAITTISARR